jgi:hypothetical protein
MWEVARDPGSLTGSDFVIFFLVDRRPTCHRQSTWGSWPHDKFFLSSKDEHSQLRIEPPTSSLRFGYLSIIIQEFRVILDQLAPILGSHKINMPSLNGHLYLSGEWLARDTRTNTKYSSVEKLSDYGFAICNWQN